jgi:hypothetical protein
MGREVLLLVVIAMAALGAWQARREAGRLLPGSFWCSSYMWSVSEFCWRCRVCASPVRRARTRTIGVQPAVNRAGPCLQQMALPIGSYRACSTIVGVSLRSTVSRRGLPA